MQKKFCNICGKEFNEWDLQQDYSIQTRICYGSAYDGDILSLDICQHCMDKLIDECKISPVYECEDDGFEEYMPYPQPPIKDEMFKRIK